MFICGMDKKRYFANKIETNVARISRGFLCLLIIRFRTYGRGAEIITKHGMYHWSFSASLNEFSQFDAFETDFYSVS